MIDAMKTIEEVYRARLSMLIMECGSQSKLSALIGKSPAQISQWLNASPDSKTGKPRTMSRETAREIERLTKKASGWMDQPISTHPNPVSNIAPGPSIRGRGRYPLISWVQAGDWTELCDNFQPGDAEVWPVTHHNLGECGFVLRVSGSSMTAPPGSRFSFPEGMLLYVNPDKEPLAGQFVIVRREKEKEATFKKLSMVDGELFLEAINPDWPRRYLKLEDGDTFCGVVVDASFGNLP